MKNNNDYSYYMLNKPAGYITAKKDEKHNVVMDFFKDLNNPSLNPVGRLDIDTEGLLFITDDGKWNNDLMQPDNHIEKTYFFWALGEIGETQKKYINDGVTLAGSKIPAKPAVIKTEKTDKLCNLPEYARGKRYDIIKKNKPESPIVSGRIIITEGKKRQVKRMLKVIGCYCIYLRREAIGEVVLDRNLAYGEYRKLTKEEMEVLDLKKR